MEKAPLRTLYKEKRQALTFSERQNFSQKIFLSIIQNFDLNNKVVHIFLPIEKFNEVITSSFIDHLYRHGNTVATSVTHFSPIRLSHCIISEKTSFEEDKFGIPTPVNTPSISEDKIDIVIVPLLAFDDSGARVGYGKGLYDRFLSKCRKDCIKIGVSFFDSETEIEGVQKEDIPLDFCITPSKIYSF